MTDTNLDQTSVEIEEDENIFLTFEVAGETYAVDIGYVTTIVGMQRISEIPDLPGFIKGAMNLRGKVIPVMDLRLRFGLPWREYDERTTIVVLDLQDLSTGLVVDKVSDVVSIPPEKIGPPPRWHAGGEKGVIQGLGRTDDRVSIILDVERLLLDKEIELGLQGMDKEAVAAASA